jgi:hypothetical protein
MSKSNDHPQPDDTESVASLTPSEPTNDMRPPPTDTEWLLTEEIRGVQPPPEDGRFIFRAQRPEAGND